MPSGKTSLTQCTESELRIANCGFELTRSRRICKVIKFAIRNPKSEILMSQPEIYRRCSSCGASFRSGALFCAQCGNPVSMATDSKHAASEEENAVAAADDATALNSASEPDAEESQKDHEGSG